MFPSFSATATGMIQATNCMQVDWFFNFSAKQLPARTRTFGGQESCIRRFIGRLAAFNERNLYSMRFLLVSLPFNSFYKYQYHPVSVSDASNLDCGTCHHCEAAGGRVSNGILWAGPIGVAMSRALGAPRLQQLVHQ